jgi:hypothetical protein
MMMDCQCSGIESLPEFFTTEEGEPLHLHHEVVNCKGVVTFICDIFHDKDKKLPEDFTGYLPHRSEYVVPSSFVQIVTKQSCVRPVVVLGSAGISGIVSSTIVSILIGCILVEQRFLNSCLMWPITVALVVGMF